MPMDCGGLINSQHCSSKSDEFLGSFELHEMEQLLASAEDDAAMESERTCIGGNDERAQRSELKNITRNVAHEGAMEECARAEAREEE
ncbi:hypothetical protein DMENIID0001_093140 [Sergentomyia squamirostris]